MLKLSFDAKSYGVKKSYVLRSIFGLLKLIYYITFVFSFVYSSKLKKSVTRIICEEVQITLSKEVTHKI